MQHKGTERRHGVFSMTAALNVAELGLRDRLMLVSILNPWHSAVSNVKLRTCFQVPKALHLPVERFWYLKHSAQ